MASKLKKLIDTNTIRVLDLVTITSGEGGSVEASELCDADDSEIGELRALERDLAILLAQERVEEIGTSLTPGVRLRRWYGRTPGRRPFGSAVRGSGGELLGNGRIPTQALIVAVEATATRRREECEDVTVQRTRRSIRPARGSRAAWRSAR
jgi:hypothetical protein